jgi:hypothetical protein
MRKLGKIDFVDWQEVPGQPGHPGMYRNDSPNKKVKDVLKELNDSLTKMYCSPEESEFSDMSRMGERIGIWTVDSQGDRLFPDAHWIACYPITGGSEGHYIHIDLIYSDGSREMLFLAKTFEGFDRAAQIAMAAAYLLDV